MPRGVRTSNAGSPRRGRPGHQHGYRLRPFGIGRNKETNALFGYVARPVWLLLYPVNIHVRTYVHKYLRGNRRCQRVPKTSSEFRVTGASRNGFVGRRRFYLRTEITRSKKSRSYPRDGTWIVVCSFRVFLLYTSARMRSLWWIVRPAVDRSIYKTVRTDRNRSASELEYCIDIASDRPGPAVGLPVIPQELDYWSPGPLWQTRVKGYT